MLSLRGDQHLNRNSGYAMPAASLLLLELNAAGMLHVELPLIETQAGPGSNSRALGKPLGLSSIPDPASSYELRPPYVFLTSLPGRELP